MEDDGLRLIFWDTETTGLPKGNDYSEINIIEIGWIVTDLKLNVLKQENYLINGEFEISDFIKNLTGISKQKTIDEGLPLDEVFLKFYQDIVKCQFIVAHNILFDYNMVLQEIKNLFKDKLSDNEYNHYINVFKSKIRLCSKYILQKECRERELEVENYKLQTLHNKIVETSEIQNHRALEDAFMILECFQILDEFDILDYFWNKHISFGKYKGKTHIWICDNDRKYFDWLTKNIYNIDTLLKKIQLFYQDEEYDNDDFIVDDHIVEYLNDDAAEEVIPEVINNNNTVNTTEVTEEVNLEDISNNTEDTIESTEEVNTEDISDNIVEETEIHNIRQLRPRSHAIYSNLHENDSDLQDFSDDSEYMESSDSDETLSSESSDSLESDDEIITHINKRRRLE